MGWYQDEHAKSSIESPEHIDDFSLVYFNIKLLRSLRTRLWVEEKSQDRVLSITVLGGRGEKDQAKKTRRTNLK